MNIRSKILTYFSILSISLIGVAFLLIYSLLSRYRMEEFQQRIKDKTITTLKYLAEIKQIDHDLLRTMDKYTINSLYKEKILIYNSKKELMYASLDDTKIEFPNNLLKLLNHGNRLIEYEEDGFDLIGIYFEFENQHYYGISKAYDQYGHSKLQYLKYVLLIIYVLIAAFILVSSFILSNQISRPINKIAIELKRINLESNKSFITVPNSKDEINLLATRFNELMQRLHDSFAFQKHAIHHISHELKTPIAKLVSNFEKMESETDITKLHYGILNQKEDTKNLADIINTLLEISKVESGNKIDLDTVRLDELIFDIVEEMKVLNETFRFNIGIDERIDSEEKLTVKGNKKLLRLALINLAANCIQYSNNGCAEIKISNENNHFIVEFINRGEIISEKERAYIFQHFYRGENSKGKRGFGLGLVLTNKIISLHNGKIEYRSPDKDLNSFKISL